MSESSSLNGFLLTRQWRDLRIRGRSTLSLSFWLATEFGPVEVVVNGQRPVCFIEQNNRDQVQRLLSSATPDTRAPALGWEIHDSELLSFHSSPVSVVYFSSQNDLYRAREMLVAQDVDIYEADIQPTDRFLMERFITGAARLQGHLRTTPEGYQQLVDGKMTTGRYQPRLKVMSLDIETSPNADRLYSVGMVVGFSDQSESLITRVLMCADGKKSSVAFAAAGAGWLEFVEDERALLRGFLNWLRDYDPDIIIGWNVINFDLRVLQKRADQLGIPFTAGRGNRHIDWRRSRSENNHYTCVVAGRWILDGIDTLKSATYNFESFSLQSVASELLGRGKLIDDVDNRAEEIGQLYRNDPLALARYNLEDCQLVWDIFGHTGLIDFSVERARLTGLPGDRYGGSVAGFDFRYLPLLHRAGRVAPMLPKRPEDVGSPGGFVMESKPGLYRDVLVLDFKSLYPSIIRTFKVDPLARVTAREQQRQRYGDEFTEIKDFQETQQYDSASMVPGFNSAAFSKRQSILPELIGELWAARDQAKQDSNHALSTAIKIMMNAFYGVLGTPGCRFFDHRLPSSITLRGHQVLNLTRQFIEEQGHDVIYGDTDSIFVHLKYSADFKQVDVDEAGRSLAQQVNQWWRQTLQSRYQISSFLELEYETHFRRFFMPTIRGSEVGSKKRYAGICVNQDKERLVFKGLEAVRTDWTLLAREFQREVYQRVFEDQPVEDYVRQLVAAIRRGEYDDQLIYRKRIRRPLHQYVRNIPPHVQAAFKAEAWLKKCGKSPRYQRGGWIRYALTVNGPEPVECLHSDLDYELILQRQIAPIIDAIGQFTGTSYAQITDPQLGLFQPTENELNENNI